MRHCRFGWIVPLCIGGGFLLASCAQVRSRVPAFEQMNPVPNAWVEYGPGGTPMVRSVVTGGTDCPSLEIDGQSLPMRVRSAPTEDGRFPDLVCEATVPVSARSPTLNGKTLPSISRQPRRILVLGDTGCRVKALSGGKVTVQDCNDPNKGWPFAELAKAAAAQKPDLVIHVGDYLYRESACPPNNPKCAGSPYGDTWDTWNADFFAPASPLLAAAPWIFVRGNHEICERAQEGFFRFLDPRPLATSCVETTDPYAVALSGLDFLVFDSAQSDITAKGLLSLRQLAVSNAILLTHRPLWMIDEEVAKGDNGDPDEAPYVASTQPQAVGVPSNVSLILSGHRHLFRALSFADHRPVQVTAGNGGTKLEGHPISSAPGASIDAGSTSLISETELANFGFLILEKQPDESWLLSIYNKTGKSVGGCEISALNGEARSLTCSVDGGRVHEKKKHGKP